jgi:hypothetical protein
MRVADCSCTSVPKPPRKDAGSHLPLRYDEWTFGEQGGDRGDQNDPQAGALYEVVLLDDAEDVIDIEPTFWPDLRQHLTRLNPNPPRWFFSGSREPD